jgi:hypothetical protein
VQGRDRFGEAAGLTKVAGKVVSRLKGFRVRGPEPGGPFRRDPAQVPGRRGGWPELPRATTYA